MEREGVSDGAQNPGTGGEQRPAEVPDLTAIGSGAAGAMAYNWLATITGPWTGPILVGVGLGILYYRKRKKKSGG